MSQALGQILRPLGVSLLLAVCLLTEPAWALEFKDDFKGTLTTLPDGSRRLYPDRQRWGFTFWPGLKWPTSYGDGTNWLAGNGECQAYLSPFIGQIKGRRLPPELRYNPFTIAEDGLHITAAPLSAEQRVLYQLDGCRRFGSGLLVSRRSFRYGQFRLVAKLPAARGSWPAFWLLPVSHRWPPEIDVFEGMAWGPHAQQIHTGVLTPKGEKGQVLGWQELGVDPSQDFHEYGLDWNAKSISFLFDGQVLATTPTPPSLQQPMYLLINLAVGGKWPYNELGVLPIDSMDPERLTRGSDLIESDYPAEMVVKSVRVTE